MVHRIILFGMAIYAGWGAYEAVQERKATWRVLGYIAMAIALVYFAFTTSS